MEPDDLVSHNARPQRRRSGGALDARSEEQSAYSLWASGGIRRPSPGQMARLGVPVGGRVRMLRASWDHPSHPL